jgi:hypothetical protein
VLGDGVKVSSQRVKQWLGEDRLPDGWITPQRMQGLIETIAMSRKIQDAVGKAKQAADHPAHSEKQG